MPSPSGAPAWRPLIPNGWSNRRCRERESPAIGDETIAFRQIAADSRRRSGKAGAGMAAGVEAALGNDSSTQKSRLGQRPGRLRPTAAGITLHPARPAAMNEPTGGRRLRRRADSCSVSRELGPDDVCLVLISGGGSACCRRRFPGISLADKLRVTRQLSQAGATIQELNAVRTRLSRIKGAACCGRFPPGACLC